MYDKTKVFPIRESEGGGGGGSAIYLHSIILSKSGSFDADGVYSLSFGSSGSARIYIISSESNPYASFTELPTGAWQADVTVEWHGGYYQCWQFDKFSDGKVFLLGNSDTGIVISRFPYDNAGLADKLTITSDTVTEL